jgi:hypothetical protein
MGADALVPAVAVKTTMLPTEKSLKNPSASGFRRRYAREKIFRF